MKNKKAIYLLIGCVAIIWGLISYRIYATLAVDDDPIIASHQPKLDQITVTNHSEDNYELYLKRDPFSSSSFAFLAEDESFNKVSKTIKPIKVKPQVQWPTISYSGYVNNSKNHQKIAIISIDAKALMMVEGSTQQGIQLLKNMGDSIKLSFNHETKYIRIN